MIQFLIFSKTHSEPTIPKLVDWIPVDSRKLPDEIIHKGAICLITGLAFESLQQHFLKAGCFDCGTKAEKIDLKRALRFDEKRNRNQPKHLIFNSTNIGAFKRGLLTFYEKHYTVDDPPCLIIIPEAIFEELLRGDFKKPKSIKKNISINKQDSLLLLMNVPDSNPLVKKLERIYTGTSIEAQHTRALIYRACQTDSPVLILGESGTGKDVIATQIYENSTTYKKGFFRVNCSALPESLLEGELFGYTKGSFTGANTDKVGLFNAAEGGTIFLDEIGDLSLANQVKILHAVENQGIRQIGSNQTKPVNVRIITATNRNLYAMMNHGTFREDLYFRINTFLINSHPLREHPEDIPILAKAYWEKKHHTSHLSNDFLEYLKTYPWPGNVRELNTLMNSLVDYFGDISPKPAHVEAIRKSRQDILAQAKINENDDPIQLLKIRSQSVLVEIQNIMNSIKIKMHPVIHNRSELKENSKVSESLKQFFSQQVIKLNELCMEPSYFKRWDVFKKTEKYRNVLDHTLANWPKNNDQLHPIWTDEIRKLDDEINQEIMEVMWGKIDM